MVIIVGGKKKKFPIVEQVTDHEFTGSILSQCTGDMPTGRYSSSCAFAQMHIYRHSAILKAKSSIIHLHTSPGRLEISIMSMVSPPILLYRQ